jgi:hypothetical protein
MKRFFPINQYAVLENDTPVHNNLEEVRSRVVDGQWKYSATTPESTLHSIYKSLYGEEVVKRCKCKTNSCKNCGCQCARRPCLEDCCCLG